MEKNLSKRVSLLTLGLLLTYISVFAQIHLQIFVKDSKQQAVERAEVSVQYGDSIVDFGITAKGVFTATVPSAGIYSIQASCVGYTPVSISKEVTQESKVVLVMTEQSILLNEVSVTAKKIPQTTATGTVYTLSQTAKECGNPFKALSEIPLLMVDVSGQSVRMANGESPLILIDGKLFNSGIAPIDPSRIESVELSEVVSARYLQMGVTKILNIRLRKDTPWYSFTELRTRHDIPYRYGFGAGRFEIGKKKFAISGYVGLTYLRHDKTSYEINESNEGVTKNRDGENKKNTDTQEGYLLLKWTPNSNDYFSAIFRGLNTDIRNKAHFDGQYTTENTSNLFQNDQSEITSNGGMLGSIYYEHTFKDNSILSSYAKYNYGFSYANQENVEKITDNILPTIVDYNSRRDQYEVSLDYDSGEKKYGNITSGASMEYTMDKDYNYVATPTEKLRTKRLNSFAYASYANGIGKLYYMASVGVQLLGISTDADKTTHWRPKASASLSWQLPHQQVLRASYYLTNSLPESNQLTTYNTSTNPWYRIEGNPYLVPIMMHNIDLKYDKSLGDFTIRLYGSHNRYNKMIESYVRTEDNIQIESYRNNGTYKGTSLCTYIAYRSNSFKASFSASYNWDKYNDQSTKGYVDLNGYIRWDFGNFFLYSTFDWKNKSYTAISHTEYHNPTNAHVQLAWQITKQLYASIAMPYYWGTRSQTNITEMSGYTMNNKIRFKSESLRPWLLVSWTLYKNPKLRIDNKNPDM